MSDQFYNEDLHCVAPFSSLVLLLSDDCLPCCNWLSDKRFPSGSRSNPNESIIELFEKSNKEVRNLFLKKEHTKYKICKKCFEGGQNQYVSHNQEAKKINHDFIVNPLLTNLHIQPSNFCNLACRMCSPWNSNLLSREQERDHNTDYRYNSEKKFEIKNLSEGTVLFESILKQLEFVTVLWFSGGEPLINREVWLMLEHAVEKGYCKNISLKFNTNGTLLLTQEKYKILKSFKKIELDISMDGVGEIAEYIRTNLNFNEWIENFKTYSNMFPNQINLTHTLSVFNIHLYDDFLDYFSKFSVPISTNFCYWPDLLSGEALSLRAKDFVIEKYQKSKYKNEYGVLSIIDFLNKNRHRKPQKTSIADYINQQDNNAITKNLYKNYRPYREIEPEWFEYLKI
jgi:hypothetical protein